MHIKRTISVLLSGLILFTYIPSIYPQYQNLASQSLFKLWEVKNISVETGLIIEARLRAIHESILRGERSPGELRQIDEETAARLGEESARFLKKYPFNYELISLKDGAVFGMRANIYKDKYGKKQLIVFYNPESPPWELLQKYGVKTPEDREFAKRGYWISSIEIPEDTGRRTFLALLAAALPAAVFLTGCVFDTSGLLAESVPDAGDGGIKPGTDAGVQPLDTIEYAVNAAIDNNDNPVTILRNSDFGVRTRDTTQRLSPLSQFVRNHNATFRYNGQNWHWTLSDEDRQYVIDNGVTYIFNGRNHTLKLVGQDINGQTKTIVFTPQISGFADYNQPYRVIIGPELVQQLALQIGLDVNTVNLHVENLESDEDFILNGFQKQYAVLSSLENITPDIISPESSTSGSSGVIIEPTPSGMRFSMTAGNNGRYAALDIFTRSGGIPLSDPDLQGAWKMDEVDLGTDSGPNGNLLTDVNGVESSTGRFGNAAQFTAADESYFTISPDDITGLHITGDITITAWVKTNGYPHNGFAIAEKIGVGATDMVDYAFYLRDGEMRSWNGIANVNGNLLVPDNEWHHVAFVRQGGTITFYLDGQPNGTFVQEFPNTSENTPLFIGTNGQGDAYGNGLLDELAIFDRALTPEEIQGVYSQVDSSDFSVPPLSTLEFRARGNAPFKLRLIDNEDRELDVFITGVDPDAIQNIAIDLEQARAIMNPAFNMDNVRLVEILFEDTFLPVPDGEELEVSIEIQGLVGMPGGTRGEYAYDTDLNDEEREILQSRLGEEIIKIDLPSIEGHPVVGIESWGGILTPDGLNFRPKDNKFSAFHIGCTIYIPAPDMIMDKIRIGGEERFNLEKALYRRNHTILYHELHEIKGWDHKQAVLGEFEDDINGLNYADIVTILLSVLIDGRIKELDSKFHELFIKKLLTQGMPLSYNTYSEILRQTLGTRIASSLYDALIDDCNGLVRTYIGDKVIDTKAIGMNGRLEEKVKVEPGYDVYTAAVKGQPEKGSILIDLDRFFVENDTLSDAVAIDTEYLERFIHFARNINNNITLVGISSKPETDKYTRQLITLIRQEISSFNIYYDVNFADYRARLAAERISFQSTVTILSEKSAKEIRGHEGLKLIAPFGSGYNRVATIWQEFRIAIEGIEKDKSEFLADIIKIATELLDNLIEKKQIKPKIRDELLRELRRNGIWYVPVYFDPRQYYLSIEQMKILLTNA